MNNTKATKATRLLTLVVALCVAAGCGSSAPDDAGRPLDAGGPTGSVTAPAQPPFPAPFTAVDQYDAEAVMIAAAEAMFSYSPGSDRGQGAAAERARPLLDRGYWDEQHLGFGVLAPISGGTWEEWAAAAATVTATAVIAADAHPDDQPARISRVVSVSIVATTPGGDVIGTDSWAAYMVARQLAGSWRVSDIAVR